MNSKITFPELIEHVAAATNTSKRMSELFLKELFATISQALINGESVRIKNLGQFKLEDVKPRKSVSVNTGEHVEIPSHKRLVFVPAKAIAERINKPFAHFGTEMLDDNVTDDLLKAIDIEMTSATNNEDDTEYAEDDAPMSGFIAPVIDNINNIEDIELPEEDETETAEVTEDAQDVAEVAPQVAEDIVPPPFVMPAVTIPETAPTSSDNNSPAAQEQTPVQEPQQTSQVTPPVFVPQEEPEVNQGPPTIETPQQPVVSDYSEPANEVYQEEQSDEYSIVELERTKREIARKSTLRGISYGVIGTILLVLLGWGVYMLGVSHGADKAKSDAAQSGDKDEASNTEIVMRQGIAEADSTTAVEEQTDTKVITDTCTQSFFLEHMAKKHYGDRVFWVYIYEENKDKIENPNSVSPGTIVVIPPAEKYNIDANNPESLKAAYTKRTEIYTKYPTVESKHRKHHRHR